MDNFSVLETLIVEASSESVCDRLEAPQWSYSQQSTVSSLLVNVPLIQDLNNLTLDLCGVKDDFDKSDRAVHLCKMITTILTRVESVRLRLPRLCPAVL